MIPPLQAARYCAEITQAHNMFRGFAVVGLRRRVVNEVSRMCYNSWVLSHEEISESSLPCVQRTQN